MAPTISKKRCVATKMSIALRSCASRVGVGSSAGLFGPPQGLHGSKNLQFSASVPVGHGHHWHLLEGHTGEHSCNATVQQLIGFSSFIYHVSGDCRQH